jgi:hypothetical protein
MNRVDWQDVEGVLARVSLNCAATIRSFG